MRNGADHKVRPVLFDDGGVEFLEEFVDRDVMHPGTVLQGFKGGELAPGAVEAKAAKDRDGLRITTDDLFDGHLFGDHLCSPFVTAGLDTLPNLFSSASRTVGGTKVSIGPPNEATSFTIDELR